MLKPKFKIFNQLQNQQTNEKEGFTLGSLMLLVWRTFFLDGSDVRWHRRPGRFSRTCWSWWLLPPGTCWWCPDTTAAATGWSSPGPGGGGGGGRNEKKDVQFCLCVSVCLCILCVFTSAASSFPSASSLTSGTGSGALRSELSSSGNVGSRDVFISQWGGVMCVLEVSSGCDAGFFLLPSGTSAVWPFGLQGDRT